MVENYLGRAHKAFDLSFPSKRIENPVKSEYSLGDLVRAKVGPAEGNLGIVVVDRNSNYEDGWRGEPEDLIAVAFAEKIELPEEAKLIFKKLSGTDFPVEFAVRWFGPEGKLDFVKKAENLDK